MSRFLFIVATAFVLFAATEVHAAMPVEYKDYPVDNTGPTPVICGAYAAAGQKCNQCHENVYASGATAYWLCVPVRYNGSCRCRIGTESKSCSGEGECWYIG